MTNKKGGFYNTAHRGHLPVHKGDKQAQSGKHAHGDKAGKSKHHVAFFEPPASAIRHGDAVEQLLITSVLLELKAAQAARNSFSPG